MNESALKERLRFIAQQNESTFNQIWKELILERFLSRLSNSAHHDKFIFKGGLLLAQYIEIKRETIDIDFLLTKSNSEKQTIEKLISEIAAVNTNDGFSFSMVSCEELDQPHMQYTGYRTTLNAQFGKM